MLAVQFAGFEIKANEKVAYYKSPSENFRIFQKLIDYYGKEFPFNMPPKTSPNPGFSAE